MESSNTPSYTSLLSSASPFTTPGPEDLVFMPNNYYKNTDEFAAIERQSNLDHLHTPDILIASLAVILIVFGLVGNSTSLIYFWQRRKGSIHPKLYVMICSVDILTCLIFLPVLVSLFNNRNPGLFLNPIFCKIWTLAMTLVWKLTMFLVMLVSVTRTLALTYPYYNIRSGFIMLSVVIYAGIICLVDVGVIAGGWFTAEYKNKEAMCDIRMLDEEKRAPHYFYSFLIQTELLLLSAVVFLSFVFGTYRLIKKRRERNSRRSKMVLGSREDAMFLQVSVTIAIFTAVFLSCHLPVYFLQLSYFLMEYTDEFKSMFKENKFAIWYAHLICRFFLGLLNAAINPCLYFSRMPNYRSWTTENALTVPKSKSEASFSLPSSIVTMRDKLSK